MTSVLLPEIFKRFDENHNRFLEYAGIIDTQSGRISTISATTQARQERKEQLPPVMFVPPPLDLKKSITAEDKVAVAIKDLLLAKEDYGIKRSATLIFRFAKFFNRGVYWADVCIDETDAEKGLWLNLGELLDCGLGITDLIQSVPKLSYQQLRVTFGFNPADLCKSFKLFNLSHLVQHFQISYEDLAVDYCVGVYDYFVELNLALSNLSRFDLSVETAMNWSEKFDEAYSKRNKPTPDSSSGMDSRMSKAMRCLDRGMLAERFKRRQSLRRQDALDDPQHWSAFLGMKLEHLYEMQVTPADIKTWWMDPFNFTMDDIINLFGGGTDKIERYYRNQHERESSSSSHSSSTRSPHHPRSSQRSPRSHSTSPNGSTRHRGNSEDWRDDVPTVWDNF